MSLQSLFPLAWGVSITLDRSGCGDFKVTLGQDNIKEVQPNTGNKMTHAFCTKCGCHIFQKPSDAKFRGLLPVTFKIENNKDDTRRVKLPESMQPTGHANYENRLLDYN